MSIIGASVPLGFKRAFAGLAVALCLTVVALALPQAYAAERAVAIPPPAFDPSTAQGSATAVLAGGCFWGMQGVFEHAKGVSKVVAGYTGGTTVNPTYEDVSGEDTGHAESIKITYDPKQVSYGQLLQIYFSVAHNPTELNYQGPDHGSSYRSNIFYTSDDQKRIADAYIAQLDKAHVYASPIVTRVDPFMVFYRAEDYHQDYLLKHPDSPYIQAFDLPKLAAFKQLLPALYRDDPVTVASN
jgi:peptide-methionine (S)-S-oxide reductase